MSSSADQVHIYKFLKKLSYQNLDVQGLWD